LAKVNEQDNLSLLGLWNNEKSQQAALLSSSMQTKCLTGYPVGFFSPKYLFWVVNNGGITFFVFMI